MKSKLIETSCCSSSQSQWQKGQILRRKKGSSRPDCVILVTNRSQGKWFSGVVLWGVTNFGEGPGFYADGSWADDDFDLYDGAIELRNC